MVNKINIYLIKRLTEVSYDEYDSFVIRAENEIQARNMAFNVSNDFYKNYCHDFKDLSKSSCEIITKEGTEEIILSSFNAG